MFTPTHVGRKFNQKLLNILSLFQAHCVTVTVDIEKAFLIVSVQESDHNVLRFLGVQNVNEDHPSSDL